MPLTQSFIGSFVFASPRSFSFGFSVSCWGFPATRPPPPALDDMTCSEVASYAELSFHRCPRPLFRSSADGSASLYYAEASFDMSSYSLQEINTWEGLHRRGAAGKSCACTTVAGSTDGERVVTGGEDGRLNAFQTGDPVAMWTHGEHVAVSSLSWAFRFEPQSAFKHPPP